MSVGVINHSQVYRRHKKFLSQCTRLLIQAANRAAKIVQKHVRTQSGFRRRSGALLRSMGTRIVPSAAGFRLEVSNTARHAQYLEFGTNPHPIECNRPAFALRFFWRRVGHVVFFRRVSHPGTPKYLFLQRATTAAFIETRQFLDSKLSQMAKEF